MDIDIDTVLYWLCVGGAVVLGVVFLLVLRHATSPGHSDWGED